MDPLLVKIAADLAIGVTANALSGFLQNFFHKNPSFDIKDLQQELSVKLAINKIKTNELIDLLTRYEIIKQEESYAVLNEGEIIMHGSSIEGGIKNKGKFTAYNSSITK